MKTVLSIFSSVEKFDYDYITKSYNCFPNFRQKVLKIAQRELNQLTDSSIFQDYAVLKFVGRHTLLIPIICDHLLLSLLLSF